MVARAARSPFGPRKLMNFTRSEKRSRKHLHLHPSTINGLTTWIYIEWAPDFTAVVVGTALYHAAQFTCGYNDGRPIRKEEATQTKPGMLQNSLKNVRSPLFLVNPLSWDVSVPHALYIYLGCHITRILPRAGVVVKSVPPLPLLNACC